MRYVKLGDTGETVSEMFLGTMMFGRRCDQFAADHGLHPAQLAIAWVGHSPATTCPIVGVSSAAQLEPTLATFDFDLTDEQYREVTGFFDTEVKEEGAASSPTCGAN